LELSPAQNDPFYRIGCAASNISRSCDVNVIESATAFSFTCAIVPDSGIAMTLPLRMVHANATAAAEHPQARQSVQAWDR
jgi:hypothetical protein